MDLLPGRTVAVGRLVSPAADRDWEPPQPLLEPADPGALGPLVGPLRELGVQVVLAQYPDESLPGLRLSTALAFASLLMRTATTCLRGCATLSRRERYLGYTRAAGVITVNRVEPGSADSVVSRSPGSTHIPCGVDIPPRFARRSAGQSLRVVAVGRMVGKKAPLLSLAAFRQAAACCPEGGWSSITLARGLCSARRNNSSGTRNASDIVTLHGAVPNPE